MSAPWNVVLMPGMYTKIIKRSHCWGCGEVHLNLFAGASSTLIWFIDTNYHWNTDPSLGISDFQKTSWLYTFPCNNTCFSQEKLKYTELKSYLPKLNIVGGKRILSVAKWDFTPAKIVSPTENVISS